ncbi:MAG: type II secretion system protein [Candidatus Krumholzibacteriota bacterium]|nr:type II secretion system protein [Candidatus Krumholzibacteriota bacterium]
MKKNYGFTLVEMMVAISIFGIVMTVATPPLIKFLRRHQSKDAAGIVMGALRKARSSAIHEKNDYIVFFDLDRSNVIILDDDGGGNGDPASGGFDPTARGNGRADAGEKVYGPYQLPSGQVFGMIAGSTDEEGAYVTKPVTFSGSPPRVIFHPNGSSNEEGLIFVMPELEFRQQEKGTDRMMVVRRSTGSVSVQRPNYD